MFKTINQEPMKRRDFVKTLPILVATPLLLVSSQAKPVRRHLVVLGSAATNLVVKYGSKMTFDSYTVVNGLKPDGCPVNFDFFPFFKPDTSHLILEEFRNQKPENLPFLELSDELKSTIEGKSGTITVLAALGNYTGTLLFQALGTQLDIKREDLRMVGTLPFLFEGSKRRENALAAIQNLKINPSQTIFPLDQIRQVYGNLSIRSAFEKADEWIVGALEENQGFGKS